MLATKTDILRLENKIEKNLFLLDQKFSSQIFRLENKIVQINAEMQLLKWMMGFVLAGILSLVLKAFF